MIKTMMLAMVGALLSTGASANVLECQVLSLVEEFTLNMNFETWSSDRGQSGDLEKIGARTYRWSTGPSASDYTITAVFARDGRSARLTGFGEGERTSGSCRFITTGRTKGP